MSEGIVCLACVVYIIIFIVGTVLLTDQTEYHSCNANYINSTIHNNTNIYYADIEFQITEITRGNSNCPLVIKTLSTVKYTNDTLLIQEIDNFSKVYYNGYDINLYNMGRTTIKAEFIAGGVLIFFIPVSLLIIFFLYKCSSINSNKVNELERISISK